MPHPLDEASVAPISLREWCVASYHDALFTRWRGSNHMQNSSNRPRVLYPNSRLTSPGSCSGHEVLELVRPMVPYTLALSSKRSRPVVSPASCRSVASQASCCRVVLRLSLLCSPHQTGVIPKNPKIDKTRQSPIVATSAQETID